MKLLSVIVPVYNVAPYLSQCLDSILQQTYSNLEIIIVDDGSTDGSSEICDEYKKNDKRISVIHKQNAGLGMARNAGLEVASGKYVSFVDSDDYLKKDLLEQLMQPIIKKGCDTVLGGSTRVDNNGNLVSVSSFKKQIFLGKQAYSELFASMLGSTPGGHDAMRMSVWSAIYSLDIIKRNKITFPSERKLISEDMIFDQLYYQKAKKVAISGTDGYYYRYNPDSLSQKYRTNKFEMCRDLYVYIDNKIDWEELVSSAKLRWEKRFILNTQSSIFQEKKPLSGKSFCKRYQAIKKICNDDVTRDIFSHYPSKQMKLKPRVFVDLVKWRMSFLLTLVVG